MPKKIEKRANGRVRVIEINDRPSMTQAQFGPQTDVNNIMAHYNQTGEFPPVRVGQYLDATQFGDYQQSLQTIMNADLAFQSLPAKLRARFSNDPAELLQFLSDPQNNAEGVSLGLYDPPKQVPQNDNQNQNSKQKQNDNPGTQKQTSKSHQQSPPDSSDT